MPCPLQLPSSDPRIFGPPVWASLHLLANNYPAVADAETQRNFRRLLFALARALPCQHCGRHFRAFLRRQNVAGALDGRQSLVRFLVEAHNSVSRHTRPEQPPYSASCAARQYAYMRAPNVPLARLWTAADRPGAPPRPDKRA